MTIKLLDNPDKLEELLTKASINYPLVEGCEYLVAENKTRLKGALGYRQGKHYPELQHIILGRGVDRRIGLSLIKEFENRLVEKGNKCYVAFIEKDDFKTQEYAVRLHFVPYEKADNRGMWFFKQIKGEKK